MSEFFSMLKRGLAIVTSALTSVFTLACPACFPALGGLLSTLGLGFLTPLGYNVWLISGLLIIAVLSFWFAYLKHRNIWVPLVGSTGATGLLLTRFVWMHPQLTILSIVGLITAGVSNVIIKKRASCCVAEKV